jgi:hypothetical protein
MTDLTKVPTHSAAIHKAGGPKFPEWCDVEKHLVYDQLNTPYTQPCFINPPANCPPACEAAVIAYALVDAHYGCEYEWNNQKDLLAASVALIEAVAGEVGDE